MKGKKSIWSRVKKSFLGQEMVDLCSAPPPRSLNTGLYRGGVNLWTGKISICTPPLPPPGREFRTGGKKVLLGLEKRVFGTFWAILGPFLSFLDGKNWGFLGFFGPELGFFPEVNNAEQTLNKRSTNAQQTLNKRSTNAQHTLNKRSANAQQTLNKRSTNAQTLNKR